MRSLVLLLSLVASIYAWNLTLNPHGERLVNRRAGDNFLVVCKVKDYDGAASGINVDWYRNGNKVNRLGSVMTIHTPYSVQLLLNRPKVSDGGEYVCKADVEGEQQEVSASLSFVEPPQFINPLTEQHPEDESTAKIRCEVKGADDLEVFWQYNGVTLDESSPRGYEFEDDKQTLVIPNFDSKKDDGVYHCNAAQLSSFETLVINVSGYSRPVITVFETPEGGRGFEGQSAQLKCGAVGKPKPEYKWFNQEGEEISNSDKYRVEDGLLVIESLSSEDAGEYRCEAFNPIGNQTKTADISIFLKPRIAGMVDITRKTGEEIEIMCRYSGEGAMKAKFLFNDEEYAVIEEDEEEQPTPNSAEDDDEEEKEEKDNEDQDEETDEETTTTDAEEQETTSDGDESEEANEEDEEESTTPQVIDEETNLLEGPSVEAEDDEEEEEETENFRKWKRSVDDGKITVRAEENVLILTVKDLTLEDAGAYHCLVENEAGTSNRTSKLLITHAPKLVGSSPSVVRSVEGKEMSIYCEVSAVPEVTWSWTVDGNEVEANGVDVVVDNQPTVSRVNMAHTEGKHFGKYVCKADNGIGEIEKEIEVVQVVAPSTPNHVDCKTHLYPNYGICNLFDEHEEAQKPTHLKFHVMKLDEMEGDFDWSDARIVTVPFDDVKLKISDLTPSTQYQVKVKAINEAGESELSEAVNMETTNAWNPDAPEEIKMTCNDICTVNWTEPNNHGSELTGYVIKIQQIDINEETGETEHVGSEFVIEVSPEETALELYHIRPHSKYTVSVQAKNEVGLGKAAETEITTDESPLIVSEGMTRPKIMLAAAIGIIFLLFIIDLICFSVNRCGLIACFCINCLGRIPSERKEKDIESGRGESGRLLDNAQPR